MSLILVLAVSRPHLCLQSIVCYTFLEAAKQIPADQRQEILDRMGQQKEIPTMGRLQYYQAEAEARRQLDTALKQEAQTRERNRTHDRDRGI